MAKKNAPDLRFRKAKAKDKPYKIADRDGLYLFVTPHEAKSWRFDYRLASVRRTLTIGRFPEVGLTAARDAVSAARALVAQGISPFGPRIGTRPRLLPGPRAGAETLGDGWMATSTRRLAISPSGTSQRAISRIW